MKLAHDVLKLQANGMRRNFLHPQFKCPCRVFAHSCLFSACLPSRLLFQVCYILKVNFVGYKISKYRDLISNPNFSPFDALGDLGSRLIATSKELRHFDLINLTYSIFTAST